MKLNRTHREGAAGLAGSRAACKPLAVLACVLVAVLALLVAPVRALADEATGAGATTAAATTATTEAAPITSLDIKQVYSTSGQVPAAWTDGTFEYELRALTPGAPLPAGAADGIWRFTITGTADKSIALVTRAGEAAEDAINFDTVGNYEYELRCVTEATDEHLWMDGNWYRLTVSVENDTTGDGIHVARLVVKDDQGTKPDHIEFDPTYKGEPAPVEPPTPTPLGPIANTGDANWGLATFSGILVVAAVAFIAVGFWLRRRGNKADDAPDGR